VSELMRPVYPGVNPRPVSNRNVVDVSEDVQNFRGLFEKILGGTSKKTTLAAERHLERAANGAVAKDKKEREPQNGGNQITDTEESKEVTPTSLAEALAANVLNSTNCQQLEETVNADSSGVGLAQISESSPGMMENHELSWGSQGKSVGYINDPNLFISNHKTADSAGLKTEEMPVGSFDGLLYEAQWEKQTPGGQSEHVLTMEQSELSGKPVQELVSGQTRTEEPFRMMQSLTLSERPVQFMGDTAQTNDVTFLTDQVLTSPNETLAVLADEELQTNDGTTDIKGNIFLNGTDVAVEGSDSQSGLLASSQSGSVNSVSLETVGSEQEQVVPRELSKLESAEAKDNDADQNATTDDGEAQMDKGTMALKAENASPEREKGDYSPGKKLFKDHVFTKLTGLGHELSSFNNQSHIAKPLSYFQPLVQEHAVVPREVVDQIVQGAHVMVRDGAVQMQIRLEPAELGKVELKITCERNIVAAHFVAENEAVKQIIESNLPQLKSTLLQNGVQAESFSVSVSDNGLTQHGGQFGRHNAFSQPQQSKAYNQEWLNEQETMDKASYNSYWTGRVNLMA
jgi:flagellar hook-length control protein FliK